MLLPNQRLYYLPKFEKFIFSAVFLLNYLFYGILSVSIYLGLPNSVISAGIKFSVFLGLSYLLLTALSRNEYTRLNTPTKILFVYILYTFLLIMTFDYSVKLDVNIMQYGKAYLLYLFFCQTMVGFFMYFLTKDRFLYLANNPWLIYVPNLASTSIIIFLYGDTLGSDGSFAMLSAGINRATIKDPIAVGFIISFFWVIFSRKIWTIFLGFLGLVISLYAVKISSSQSLIISLFLVCITALIFSFRNRTTFTLMICAFLLGVFVVIPYLWISQSFERLSQLANLDLLYTYGGTYDVSRIDLFLNGWNAFLSSPIVGGNAFLPDSGMYTHFFIMDAMMAAGILGIATIIAMGYLSIKVIKDSYRLLPLDYVWIVMMCVYYISQCFFHGSVTSLYSAPFALVITLSMLFERSGGLMLPSKGDGN